MAEKKTGSKTETQYTYGNDTLLRTVSNDITFSKYRASDLEQDIMNIAITRLQHNTGSKDGCMHARLYPTDINRILKRGKALYRDLPIAAKMITGHSAVIQTDKGFVAFAIVTKATYENHILDIEFSSELEKYFFKLSGKFNSVNIGIMAILKGYSKRLYEVLNAYAYKIDPNVNEGKIAVEYRISELKFMIGVANIDDSKVQMYIKKKDNEEDLDWDYIYEHITTDKMYERYDSFRVNVLEKAREEINNKTDISFDYQPLREGRFIKKVRFFIYREEAQPQWQKRLYEIATGVEEGCSDQYKQLTFDEFLYEQLYEKYEGHNCLTKRNIEVFIEEAKLRCKKDSDLDVREVIKEAIEYADTKEEVKDYVGYIISLIRRGVDKPIEVMEGSAQIAQTIKDIKREMDENKEEIARSVWEKTKRKEDFLEFENFMEREIGLTTDEIELTKTPTECFNYYVDWKLGKFRKG